MEVYPSGRRLRVRGVQVHGSSAGRARAGQRTAVNLADIEPAELGARRRAQRTRPLPGGHAHRLPPRPAGLRQAPQAPRAGALPLRHRRNRGRSPHARNHRRHAPRQHRLRAPGSPPARAAAARRPLHHPHVFARGHHRRRRGGGYRRRALSQGRRHPGAPGNARLRGRRGAHRAAGARSSASAWGWPRWSPAPRSASAKSPLPPRRPRSPRSPNPSPGTWTAPACKPSANASAPPCASSTASLRWPPAWRARNCAAALPSSSSMPCWSPPRTSSAEGEIVRLRSHKVVLKEDEEQARGKIERAFEAAGLAVPALPEVLAASGVEAGARPHAAADPAAREAPGPRRRRSGLPPHRHRRPARTPGRSQRRALPRPRFQGVDRHLAQVRHPAAGISGSRKGHPPRRRRARSRLTAATVLLKAHNADRLLT